MKGVIFNLFEDFVCESFGDEVYESILDAAELRTTEPFIGPGLYPDEDLLALVGVAVDQLGIALPDALRAFGRFALPRLVEAHPDFAESECGAKDFLLSVDSVIHVEVKKLWPDAQTPSFRYDDPGQGALSMMYASARKFCPLVEGFIDGVADHFGEKIEREHTTCMHDGAEECVFRLQFAPS